jgi:transposase
MDQAVAQGWAGIDVGKGHHWVCLIDESGSTLWSRKVVDEAAILDAIGEVLGRAQQATYVQGRTVNQMSTAYAGEAKTDARDAYVIAETVRHRGEPDTCRRPSDAGDRAAAAGDHRTDLVADRVRLINRLRDVLSGYFPALERAFDYSTSRGALVLLTGYQTPAAIRARGRSRLTSWFTARKVRSAEKVATLAAAAADAQHTTVPGQDVAASIVAELAVALLELDQRIHALDARIGETFHAHPQAKILESMPGIGTILGAELIAAAGDLSRYADAGHLASAAGLVPVPRDSGRRTGNLHRPMRYSRKLRRVFYLSAQSAMMREGPNRDFYLKKRGQGLGHVQALIALSRRRVDVLWALLRDNRVFTPAKPEAKVA